MKFVGTCVDSGYGVIETRPPAQSFGPSSSRIGNSPSHNSSCGDLPRLVSYHTTLKPSPARPWATPGGFREFLPLDRTQLIKVSIRFPAPKLPPESGRGLHLLRA